MKKMIHGFAVVALVLGVTSTASAVLVPQFNKTTNDGVFTITPSQATFLGVPTADRVGFFRVREGSGTTFNAGDTFDQTSIFNSVTSNAGSILGLYNGTNTDLLYSGSSFDALGTTTIPTPDTNSYFRGVMFAFNSSAGNIVFRGTSTFNGGQASEGFAAIPNAVPEASAILTWSVLGLAVSSMRRRRG